MKIINKCSFIDPQSKQEFHINNFELLFHICKIEKTNLNKSFKIGEDINLRFNVSDQRIKKYSIDVKCTLVGMDTVNWFFTISTEAKSNLSPLSFNDDWIFKDINPVISLQGAHPWYISMPIKFNLLDFHQEKLTLHCIKGDNLIFHSGLNLKLKATIPEDSDHELLVEIEDILSINDSHFIIAAKLIKAPKNFKESLSFYFLKNNHKSSFENLQKADLPLPSFKNRVECTVASSSNDTKKVLELRKEAYSKKKNSKIRPDASLESFSDHFDEFSSILMVKLGTKVIATGRSVFNFGNYQQSEIVSLGFNPPHFIRQGGFVEVSRLATHPLYRGKDLFVMLLSFGFRTGLLTKHKYLLATCEDDLLPVYKKWGGVLFKQKVTHKLENIELNVIYFDLHNIMKKAKFASKLPIIPNYYKTLADELLRLGELPFE